MGKRSRYPISSNFHSKYSHFPDNSQQSFPSSFIDYLFPNQEQSDDEFGIGGMEGGEFAHMVVSSVPLNGEEISFLLFLRKLPLKSSLFLDDFPYLFPEVSLIISSPFCGDLPEIADSCSARRDESIDVHCFRGARDFCQNVIVLLRFSPLHRLILMASDRVQPRKWEAAFRREGSILAHEAIAGID